MGSPSNLVLVAKRRHPLTHKLEVTLELVGSLSIIWGHGQDLGQPDELFSRETKGDDGQGEILGAGRSLAWGVAAAAVFMGLMPNSHHFPICLEISSKGFLPI